ncbi:MAG TPA: EipA family protein [Crenalkalicoccus sp.]|jgi:hypothetical protein|nr:EipA family protein [Crenalkalicoccus sp.]
MNRRAAATALPIILAAAGLASALPTAGLAQSPGGAPDGTVTLSGGSVAAGIGFTWGSGTLVFQGRQHQFSVRGLSVVAVGATDFTATGAVYNLQRLQDFSGDYVAVSAGVTVAGGGSVTYLRNQNGVVIQLDSTTQGLNLNLSAEGVRLTLTS